jgi:cellulose synthase/poly-beta-1,6-N-acetylglucosamine synthase-like glycosyltransferase
VDFIIPSVVIIFLFLSLAYSLKKRLLSRKRKSDSTNIILHPKNYAYTVLIPAHNEFKTLVSTITSVVNQNHKPTAIIVLDDSSDRPYTEISNTFSNVEILRFDTQRGKSTNINHALETIVKTPYLMVLDADTRLESNYAERIFQEAGDFDVSYGTILPDFRFPSLYAYYRIVESLYTHEITKKAMSYLNALNISGCCAIYKTQTLRELGGIPMRTATEDMDLAWIMVESGKRIVYVESSIAYTLEPTSFKDFTRQIHRWYGGFWETLKVHGGKIGDSNGLTFLISIYIGDIILFTPFWIAFLIGSFTLFLSRFHFISALLDPISANSFIGFFISTWQRWFPFASSEIFAITSLLIDISMLVIVTMLKAKKLKYITSVMIGLPVYYLLNWYSKFVWLKCGVLNLFSKPKEVLTWQ